MSWTKRQLVTKAFSKSGLGGTAANVSASQLQDALFDLDSMMAMWKSKGINLGYPIPTTQAASSLDDNALVPVWANSAIYLNLAIILSGDLGKIVAPSVSMAAKDAYDTMIKDMAQPIPMQFPSTMPAGAGNKPWRGYSEVYLNTPIDLAQVDPLRTPSATLGRQYASPTATGFNVAVNDGPDSVYLILTPAAAYATGTITLPSIANAAEGQQVLVISSQAVTVLTVDGNGAVDVVDEPSTLAANTPFRLQFDGADLKWKLMT